ncbi:MAG: hypothetical protein IIC78_06500 [Chloroflexi bacterium]|nr:hypothetical protein [Chloroflexota bacterium]
MISKVVRISIGVLVLSLVMVGAVFAQDEIRPPTKRAMGEITTVNAITNSFTLHARSGEDLQFKVNEQTKFRSPDGSIHGIEDLQAGMKALVVAIDSEGNQLLALMVAAGLPEDVPDARRVSGVIESVNVGEGMFTLETKDGEQLQFVVNDRTRFRSRDQSINGLEDLEPGMAAIVGAVEQTEGPPLALIVGAGKLQDDRERIKVVGEITNVVPGQGTFDLTTHDGNDLTFHVVDKTVFRSRDGSIEDIYDLKAGMKAIVVAIKGEDGNLNAMLVAAGNPEDVPQVDIKAAGEITVLGDRSFTIQTRNQGSLTFSVDGSTIFKSRNGEVTGFDDLQIGMYVGVGAKELGSGQLKAIFVGVARSHQRSDSDADGRPRSAPEGRFEGRSSDIPTTSL